MCTSPIKIKNGSRRYRDGIDKMFFRVPCGHCKECIERKKDDWFVRAYFEFMRVQKTGGVCFFPTFSYSNEYLPIWRDFPNGDGTYKYEIPVFDPLHVKRFRDKLRVYMGRDWFSKKVNGEIIYKSCVDRHYKKRQRLLKDGWKLYWKGIKFKDSEGNKINTIRFFLACEYGDDYGRSHIHGLFFVPFQISPGKFLFFLRKAWIYGWVMTSKKHGLIVKSANAVQYCMKYIEKPSKWFEKYHVHEYISYLENQIDLWKRIDYLPFTDADMKLQEFKKVIPSHFQSLGFGYDMLPYLEEHTSNVIEGTINLASLGFLTKNRFRFQIPRYILRKLLVAKDENNTDIPTKFSMDVFFERLENMFNSECEKLYFLQTKEAFKAHFSFLKLGDDVLNKMWVDIFPVHDKIPQLVVYNYVYRDVPYNEMLGHHDLQFFMDNALDFVFNQKFNYDTPVEKGKSAKEILPLIFDDNRFTFGKLVAFHGFDKALDLIEKLNTILSHEFTRAHMLKLSNRDKLWKCKNDLYVQYNPIV